MEKKQRSRKYYAPQTEGHTQMCDHPGCNKKGEYRAPKDRSLKDYFWFCLDHVQEYNAKWNYYEGISDKEPEEEVKFKPRSNFKFKSKVKYNFGYNLRDDFGFFDEYSADYSNMNEVYFTQEEKKYLRTMEIDSKNLDVKTLKAQYKKLAKKYHPDTNQGDKEKEEKFKEVTHAYQVLLCKISIKNPT